jgi:effector-binding domain-containing protein
MLDKPVIVQTEAQHAAVIHITVPREEIREVMAPGMAEVRAAVAGLGLEPTGAMFAHHLRVHPHVFDFELGLPVAKPIAPAGRVQPGQLPAATVARTVYHGAYEGLEMAWSELETWIELEGHTSAPDIWESYLVGPETTQDPLEWRTELNQRLLR